MTISQAEIESVTINGTTLYYSVNRNHLDRPVILYLHGGPGDTCIPMTTYYNVELEDAFTVVNLDQRGAGLSYYPFADDETLTIQLMLDDLHAFVEYILAECHQDQVIIMAHSWGSVLGLLFVEAFPELVRHYIGIGQIVNMERNLELQLKFVKRESDNPDELTDLDFINDPEASHRLLSKLTMKYRGTLYRKMDALRFFWRYLRSPYYNLRDLIHRLKGSFQSRQHLGREFEGVNFDNKTHFDVPMTFICGRHDYNVPSQMVDEYVRRIDSPTNLIWFQHSAHSPQWEEADRFNDVIKNLIIDNPKKVA